MTALVGRRLLLLVPQLLAVSVLTFALVHLVPGDPVTAMLGSRASPERVAALRAQLGLDDPLPARLARHLGGLLRGDLGTSVRGGTPVAQEIALRAGATAQLAAVALALAVAAGVPAGLLAGARGGRAGTVVGLAAAAGLAVPVVFLAPALRALTGVPGGVLVPALCAAVAPAAVLARLTRAVGRDVAAEPYVVTARAKGLGEAGVFGRHVLRGAFVPVATFTGLIGSSLLTGTVFVEVVFARPGLGRFTVDAVLARDLPQVQGVVLVGALVFLLGTLVVDLACAVVDPRLAEP